PAAPGVAGVIGAFAALRYRIPSSPMPRSTLGEPDRGQPTPSNQAELGEGVDGVLATGRNEAACRRTQRRHHVAVQLDYKNQSTHGPCRKPHRRLPPESNARPKTP